MMWALGSGGSSLSSSSNLSPLAQPFTVDRFNNSKPILSPHLNDSPYSLPSSQSWQNIPHISASRSGFLSEDSMKTTSVPLVDEKSILQSADPSSSYWSTQSFGANSSMDECSYISEGRPYYLPYASPVVSNSTPFLPINESTPDVRPTSGVQLGSVSSQVDYTQSLAGLHYSHSSSGIWNGLAHKKLGKKLQGNANLSFDNVITGGSNHFQSSINQGANALECRAESQDDSGTFCGNFSERETNEGFFKMGQVKEKYQKTYNACEKCIQPLDSHPCNDKPTPKSSTTVVIRPPVPAAVQISSKKCARSFQTRQDGKEVVQIDGLCSPPAPFKGEESHQPLNSIGKGMHLLSKQYNVHTDDNDHNIVNASSWPLKESLAVQPHVDDTLKETFESCSGSNATFTKGMDDMYLPSDGIQVVRYNEGYQDGLDQHNPNVDSPCWKGTFASRTSPFDVEHMHPSQVNRHFSSEAFSGSTSSMLYHSNVVQNENGSSLDGKTILKGLLIENCPAKDHRSTDAGNVEPESQPQDSRDPSNCRTSNFCDSVDSVLNMNDVSQGCNVALDAVEKVLHSPSSQEQSELAHRHGRLFYPNLNVQTLVMAIHNLSELLRFQCSNDKPLFGEALHQALNHTINNLNACIPKKIETMNTTQDKTVAVQNSVYGTKEEGFHTDTGLTLPQIKIKPASCLHGQPTLQHMHGCDVRNEDLKPFLSICNPIIPKEDIMSQAIGKVLQENFEFDGEMESQALLFKNLWLEAEAKLCSLSYKARFDHMKIAMQMQNSTRAVDASAEKSSGFIGISDIDGDECSLQKPCIQSQSISHSANDILGGKGSVTSIYNILKYREENFSPLYVDKERDSNMICTGCVCETSNRMPHIEHAATFENISSLRPSTSNCDAESSVMTRLNILRGRDSYLGEEQLEPMHVKMSEQRIRNARMVPPFPLHPSGMVPDMGSFAAAGKESTKAHFSSAIDAVQQTNMHNRAASTLHNTSSSDWEHVLKDDFVAWHG